jgi:hypothetical protein
MREIKFRVYDKTNKRMLQPTLELIEIKDGWAVLQPERDKPHGVISEPMQYTGLKDKNGKEIYEGDIITLMDQEIVPITDEGQGPIEEFAHLLPVIFKDGCFGVESDGSYHCIFSKGFWSFDKLNDEGAELDVIGNIYENPELL